MFDDLLNALYKRIQQPGSDAEQQAAIRQNLAIRQLQSLQDPLAQFRQEAGDAMLANGSAQIGETYDQADSQLISGLAGRKLLGSSGHGRERGRLDAGRRGAVETNAQSVRDWLGQRESADNQTLNAAASDALKSLEAGNIGYNTSNYQDLINRMNQDISRDAQTATSMAIGDFARGPVGGFMNYGFDRANTLNNYNTTQQMGSVLGLDGQSSRTNQQTFAPFS